MATYNGIIRELSDQPGVHNGRPGVVRTLEHTAGVNGYWMFPGVCRTLAHLTGVLEQVTFRGAVKTLSRSIGFSLAPGGRPAITCWVREYQWDYRVTGSSYMWGPTFLITKLVAFFLEKILGYTYLSSYTASGNYRSFEKQGWYGTFSGSDKNFTDSSGVFSTSDIGKLLVVCSTTGWNAGIYKILTCPNSYTLGIETRTGPAEFPAAETNVSWYLFSESYSVPTSWSGDYIRYRSPAGWGLQFNQYGFYQYYYSVAFVVSPNCVFSGTNAKLLPPVRIGYSHFNYAEPSYPNEWFVYMAGDTAGTKLWIWVENYWYGGNQGISIGPILPIETGHAPDELIAATGFYTDLSVTDAPRRHEAWFNRAYDYKSSLGNGFVWINDKATARSVFAMENAYNAYATGFSKKGGEINHRTGKNDLLLGTTFVGDAGGGNRDYEYKGVLTNHWSVRNSLHRRMTLDVNGVKDMFHVNDGIVVPWPGVTPQY